MYFSLPNSSSFLVRRTEAKCSRLGDTQGASLRLPGISRRHQKLGFGQISEAVKKRSYAV